LIAGTKAEIVISIIEKIPLKECNQITKITLDITANMKIITKNIFKIPHD
jgi:hypothetical protein